MKSKLLEIHIRRHELVPAFDEERAVDCPICSAGTGAPARAGLLAPLQAETDRNVLLLVSDEAGLGARLSNAADLAGLAFMQINDSVNALRLAAQDRPAVVFLDLDLPRLAGWEAAERFLQGESCPPLILLTGRTGHFGLGAAIHAGAMVDKSASPVQLLAQVDTVLSEPDTERVDRQARQRLLIRWLRPYDWTVPEMPVNRHWGINE